MILKCKTCWLDFSSDRSNKKYCSKNCYTCFQKGTKLSHIDYKNRKTKTPKQKQSTCASCWLSFSHWEWRESKYCSKTCWNKRVWMHNEKCLLCGTTFFSYKTSWQKYCNKLCYFLHLRELKKWDKCHLWKWWKTGDNKIARSRTVYKDWRTKVFMRDNYMCQKCFVSWSQKNLNAHHKLHFAKYEEQRYNIDNWITLCVDCHRLEHKHKF